MSKKLGYHWKWPGIAVLALLPASAAFAQITPAAGYTPPDDTPKINVGAVIYANYVYTDTPTTKDADGNTIHANSFDTSRAYINVTGNLSHLIAYRITTDVGPRFSTTATGLPTGASVTSNYNGSLVIRLKYGYGQINFDDFAPHGSWARIGQQQTPYVDYMENIYRYRFQGTVFAEREGFLTSSDFGLSTHFNFPNNYGDVHVGVYNGDGYSAGEANDQKALQGRLTLRPIPRDAVLRGLRLNVFYDADHFIKSGEKKRFIGGATFEHKYVNLAAEYLSTENQTSIKNPLVKSEGWWVWATPKTTFGLEALLRYEDLKPNKSVSAHRKRTIAGVSYWFKTQKSAAILADYEHVKNDLLLNLANETRYGIHTLWTF
jgi:hypothetical protein